MYFLLFFSLNFRNSNRLVCLGNSSTIIMVSHNGMVVMLVLAAECCHSTVLLHSNCHQCRQRRMHRLHHRLAVLRHLCRLRPPHTPWKMRLPMLPVLIQIQRLLRLVRPHRAPTKRSHPLPIRMFVKFPLDRPWTLRSESDNKRPAAQWIVDHHS